MTVRCTDQKNYIPNAHWERKSYTNNSVFPITSLTDGRVVASLMNTYQLDDYVM